MAGPSGISGAGGGTPAAAAAITGAGRPGSSSSTSTKPSGQAAEGARTIGASLPSQATRFVTSGDHPAPKPTGDGGPINDKGPNRILSSDRGPIVPGGDNDDPSPAPDGAFSQASASGGSDVDGDGDIDYPDGATGRNNTGDKVDPNDHPLDDPAARGDIRPASFDGGILPTYRTGRNNTGDGVDPDEVDERPGVFGQGGNPLAVSGALLLASGGEAASVESVASRAVQLALANALKVQRPDAGGDAATASDDEDANPHSANDVVTTVASSVGIDVTDEQLDDPKVRGKLQQIDQALAEIDPDMVDIVTSLASVYVQPGDSLDDVLDAVLRAITDQGGRNNTG